MELLLFSTNLKQIEEAVAAGIDGIIVDLERGGKRERQLGMDTEINQGSYEDLSHVRRHFNGNLICRIDNPGGTIKADARKAIECGADEIFLPMLKSEAEVENLVLGCGKHTRACILVETEEAVVLLPSLAHYPLSRVYVGFNDLSIARGTFPDIFQPLIDGTVEHLRKHCPFKFGFGGLTLPDRGSPVPCFLLMSEMARTPCDFTFLRRSFLRDVKAGQYDESLKRIRREYQQVCSLSKASLSLYHEDLKKAISEVYR